VLELAQQQCCNRQVVLLPDLAPAGKALPGKRRERTPQAGGGNRGAAARPSPGYCGVGFGKKRGRPHDLPCDLSKTSRPWSWPW